MMAAPTRMSPCRSRKPIPDREGPQPQRLGLQLHLWWGHHPQPPSLLLPGRNIPPKTLSQRNIWAMRWWFPSRAITEITCGHMKAGQPAATPLHTSRAPLPRPRDKDAFMEYINITQYLTDLDRLRLQNWLMNLELRGWKRNMSSANFFFPHLEATFSFARMRRHFGKVAVF